LIQDVIRAVADLIPQTPYGPWNYLFGDAAVLNIRADHEDFPIVALSHRIFGTAQTLPTGRRYVTYNVQMYFLAKTDFKYRKDDTIDVTASQAMEKAMRQFELLLAQSEFVDTTQPNPVQMGRFELLYNELDANCDGVVVLFDVRLSDEGFDYCFPIPATTAPATTVPATTLPQTTLPISTAPPTTLIPTTLPETTIPETTIPATTLPQTTLPQTTIPPTTAFDPGLGDMTIPETFTIR
jgi:hypothetical protein